MIWLLCGGIMDNKDKLKSFLLKEEDKNRIDDINCAIVGALIALIIILFLVVMVFKTYEAMIIGIITDIFPVVFGYMRSYKKFSYYKKIILSGNFTANVEECIECSNCDDYFFSVRTSEGNTHMFLEPVYAGESVVIVDYGDGIIKKYCYKGKL